MELWPKVFVFSVFVLIQPSEGIKKTKFHVLGPDGDVVHVLVDETNRKIVLQPAKWRFVTKYDFQRRRIAYLNFMDNYCVSTTLKDETFESQLELLASGSFLRDYSSSSLFVTDDFPKFDDPLCDRLPQFEAQTELMARKRRSVEDPNSWYYRRQARRFSGQAQSQLLRMNNCKNGGSCDNRDEAIGSVSDDGLDSIVRTSGNSMGQAQTQMFPWQSSHGQAGSGQGAYGNYGRSAGNAGTLGTTGIDRPGNEPRYGSRNSAGHGNSIHQANGHGHQDPNGHGHQDPNGSSHQDPNGPSHQDPNEQGPHEANSGQMATGHSREHRGYGRRGYGQHRTNGHARTFPRDPYGGMGNSGTPHQYSDTGSARTTPFTDGHRYGAPGSVGGLGQGDGKQAMGSSAQNDPHRSQTASQAYHGVQNSMASASSNGGQGAGSTQSQVQGSFSGSGSFSGQSQSSGGWGQSSSTHVQGGHQGAASQAGTALQGGLGSQSQVQIGSSGQSAITSQSNYRRGGSSTNLQASPQGGQAGAQATGDGATNSQAQISFANGHATGSNNFNGGGQASAQSQGSMGQAQSQLFGQQGQRRSFSGAAQAGSGILRPQVRSGYESDRPDTMDPRSRYGGESQPNGNSLGSGTVDSSHGQVPKGDTFGGHVPTGSGADHRSYQHRDESNHHRYSEGGTQQTRYPGGDETTHQRYPGHHPGDNSYPGGPEPNPHRYPDHVNQANVHPDPNTGDKRYPGTEEPNHHKYPGHGTDHNSYPSTRYPSGDETNHNMYPSYSRSDNGRGFHNRERGNSHKETYTNQMNTSPTVGYDYSHQGNLNTFNTPQGSSSHIPADTAQSGTQPRYTTQTQGISINGLPSNTLKPTSTQDSSGGQTFYDAGETIPGVPGYQVPDGYRARLVSSHSGGARANVYGPGQAQSQSLNNNFGQSNGGAIENRVEDDTGRAGLPPKSTGYQSYQPGTPGTLQPTDQNQQGSTLSQPRLNNDRSMVGTTPHYGSNWPGRDPSDISSFTNAGQDVGVDGNRFGTPSVGNSERGDQFHRETNQVGFAGARSTTRQEQPSDPYDYYDGYEYDYPNSESNQDSDGTRNDVVTPVQSGQGENVKGYPNAVTGGVGEPDVPTSRPATASERNTPSSVSSSQGSKVLLKEPNGCRGQTENPCSRQAYSRTYKISGQGTFHYVPTYSDNYESHSSTYGGHFKLQPSDGQGDGSSWQETNHSQASICGYFTFSCNIAYGSNRRTKICIRDPKQCGS